MSPPLRRPRPARVSPSARLLAAVRRRGAVAALLMAGVAVPAAPAPVGAQASTDGAERAQGVNAEVARLERALLRDRRAHLGRVGAWGGLNLVGGSILAVTADPGSRGRAFGTQSAGWGAVNVALAAWGLLGDPGEPLGTLEEALEAEDGWGHLLLVNLGLNVGYAAVGGTLLALAGEVRSDGDALRGHGAALVVQGAGLFVLDWLAWRASGARLAELRGRVGGRLEAGPAPGSASVTLLSVPVG